MDDLVTRLREIAWEAADEIQRLRNSVAFWKARFEDEQHDHEATLKHCDDNHALIPLGSNR